MYEHKVKIWKLSEILDEMYADWYRLAHFDKETQYSIWDREIKKKRTITNKEPQKIITIYFSEHTVKWLCGFYKDLEELYFEWVKNRAECGKFKPFNETSEKSAWKKLWQFPKPVAERMLEVASAQSYGRIYDISEQEREQIMKPLREKKHREEKKMEGFETEEDKQKAELRKQQIEEVIRNNPQFREEARRYIQENNPKVVWKYQETMIQARIAMMANDLLNK